MFPILLKFSKYIAIAVGTFIVPASSRRMADSQPYQKFPRPNAEPPSLDEIRAAIPKRLFVRSTLHSLSFFVRDLVVLGILYSTMLYFSAFLDKFFFLYPVIWFVIGTYFWALFVVGMWSLFFLIHQLLQTLIHSQFVAYFQGMTVVTAPSRTLWWSATSLAHSHTRLSSCHSIRGDSATLSTIETRLIARMTSRSSLFQRTFICMQLDWLGDLVWP